MKYVCDILNQKAAVFKAAAVCPMRDLRNLERLID
jgi:hypothetical protein